MSKEVVDFLAHYGVKGMKWGVRKAPSAGDVARSHEKARIKEASKKKYSNDEILAARRRQGERAVAYLTAEKRAPRLPSGKLQLTKETAKRRWDLIENDDVYVAARKTTGEKLAAKILLGPIGGYYTSDANTHRRNTQPTAEATIRRARRAG